MALEGWELFVTGIGVVGGTVGITKLMLDSAVKTIKDHCGVQRGNCEKEQNNLWTRVNSHGHKGLDSNGSKVTV